MSSNIINKNCKWYEIIEDTVHYCQSDFSISKILGQLSDYDDILNRQIQAFKIKSNDRFLSFSNMRVTVQEYQYVNSIATINASEKTRRRWKIISRK